MSLDGKTILVTGGTGSLGRAFIKYLLSYHAPHKVIVYSRDEYKQSIMEREFADKRLRFHIGDVRDLDRLRWSFRGVDIVVHAAAMKQVGSCEYNPAEAKKTNCDGAQNVVDATRGLEIQKVIGISSDKAVEPVNLYGAAKMVAEKLFIDGNVTNPIFSCTRWGNIENSRGAVIPYFKELVQQGRDELPLTHKDMTRFIVGFDDAIAMLMRAIEGPPGLIWALKSPSVRIRDIVEAMDCRARVMGLRSGEKLHEVLVTGYEAVRAYENERDIILLPQRPFDTEIEYPVAGRLPMSRAYSSDNNTFLSVEEIRERMALYD